MGPPSYPWPDGPAASCAVWSRRELPTLRPAVRPSRRRAVRVCLVAASKPIGSTPKSGPGEEQQRKYTLLLVNSVANDLDEDTLALSRAAGRKVDKSEVVRVLVGLLHSDPELRSRVASHLAS